MTLTIRCPQPEDANTVRALVRASYALSLDRMEREPAPMSADYPALISRQFVMVAQKDSQIAGILVSYPRDNAYHVENIARGSSIPGAGDWQFAYGPRRGADPVTEPHPD